MRDAVLLAYRSIRERKARSILTVLGIAVGIAAIVSLMSVGYGMEEAITGELTAFADIISVYPGKIAGATYLELGSFTDRDVSDLQRIGGIKDITTMTYDAAEVEFRPFRKRLMRFYAFPYRINIQHRKGVKNNHRVWISETQRSQLKLAYLLIHKKRLIYGIKYRDAHKNPDRRHHAFFIHLDFRNN
jgi:ABC-type antimicrobial peptide transport system, permease component